MEEKESVLSKVKPETRLQKSMRGALRWVLGALLAFGLGALLIAFALYVPTRQKLDKANADLEHANATITANTEQITTLQKSNATQQKNLDSATLQLYVLKALSGVRGARLAVATDDFAGASLSLNQTSQALVILSGLLGADHKDVLTAIQTSAAKALADIKTDLKSAQPELDQLTKNLVQLENDLFTNP